MRAFRVILVIVLVLVPITAVPSIGAPAAEDSSRPVSTPGATASGSPGTIKQPSNNSTSYLAIKQGRINNTTIDTVSLDVGGSVVVNTREIVRTVNVAQFHAAIQNASNKQAVVDAALDRAANRTAALRARQTAAIMAYNNGDLSTEGLLRELAIIAEKATQLRTYVGEVGSVSRSAGSRVNYLQAELATLLGPVRTRIQAALRGNSSYPQRYFVQTSARGVVLATIDDRTYIREVYLTGARTVPNSTGLSPSEARNLVKNELYPVAGNWYGFRYYTYKRGLYQFRFDDTLGHITVSMNKSSGEIFYEERVITIVEENTADGPTNTSGQYALSTRVTFPGGYMRVLLTNRENGDPRNGTISIGNKTIGVTGEDGKLLLLQPRKPTTITASVNGETVSVTVGNTSQAESTPSGPAIGPSASSDSNSNSSLSSESMFIFRLRAEMKNYHS
jgi:hypothetical protein